MKFGHPERRFYFALARELGMTVKELLSKISSRELTEWKAFFELENAEMKNAEARSNTAR